MMWFTHTRSKTHRVHELDGSRHSVQGVKVACADPRALPPKSRPVVVRSEGLIGMHALALIKLLAE